MPSLRTEPSHSEPKSFAGGGEHQAFLCKQSGKLYCYSEICDDSDILPDDIDDTGKFLQLPDKKELDLGKSLALAFTREFIPSDFDDVRQFFSRRGAYARFKRCWINGARSPSGMLSRRKPRKEPCGSGAR